MLQSKPKPQETVTVASLRIAKPLANFISNEALPRTGLSPDMFWSGVAVLIRDFARATASRSPRAIGCRQTTFIAHTQASA
jgi:hypothetical protein